MKTVMRGFFGVTIAVLVLGGCATTAKWPWMVKSGNNASPCASGTCTPADAVSALSAASAFCRQVQNYYEASGTITSRWKLATAITGTLAGAVAAPIAKGSGKNAWAGLSGSANGLQQEMEDAFSSVLNAKRRAAVTKVYLDTISSYDANNAPDINVAVSVSMAAKCAMAPAQVDADGLAQLMKPSDSSNGTEQNIKTSTPQQQPAASRPTTEKVPGAGVAVPSSSTAPKPPATDVQLIAPPPVPSVK
ncbi:hypothetical protein [Dyella sp. GSA-30]|uniref:hypothetical protein n=1 Tax=Dyella sp. GSA-30 TaxID=2994496 RepID=UPI002490E535|nr:hypothetical protein [Dyella sp. GSA-30]